MEASTERNPKMAREKHKVSKHLILFSQFWKLFQFLEQA